GGVDGGARSPRRRPRPARGDGCAGARDGAGAVRDAGRRAAVPRPAALAVRLRPLRALVERPDVAIAHTFRKPPYGGSNQFLIALRGEFERRGLRVAANLVARRTRACVINSYVFDERALRRMLHPGCRVVHRLDGPLSVYRGFDNGTDRYLSRVNLELADVTVFQSRYSLDACRALGLEFREPRVIPNAVDSAIFHPPAARAPLDGRPVRLVATSWSDHPNKGAATLARLEEL